MITFRVSITTNRRNNHWIQSIMYIEGYHQAYEYFVMNEDGNAVTRKLIDEFKSSYPELTFLEERIITASENDRRRFLEENRKVYNLAVEQNLCSDLLRKHMSCWTKIDKSGAVTRQRTKMNGIPTSDIKHHCKRFDGNRAVMEFFNKNQCPVCRDSFKEVLEEDRHITTQPCGHPVCCKCCDDILRTNQNPSCPICREDMDIEKFHVMKFDTNLQPIPEDRRIYY